MKKQYMQPETVSIEMRTEYALLQNSIGVEQEEKKFDDDND